MAGRRHALTASAYIIYLFILHVGQTGLVTGDHAEAYMSHCRDHSEVFLIVLSYFDSYTFALGTLKNSDLQDAPPSYLI
jgi:hypothetical protein